MAMIGTMTATASKTSQNVSNGDSEKYLIEFPYLRCVERRSILVQCGPLKTNTKMRNQKEEK